MPGGSSVLKEFLVKIGFKVDEAKFRHFQEAMHTTAKNAVEMSKTLSQRQPSWAQGSRLPRSRWRDCISRRDAQGQARAS